MAAPWIQKRIAQRLDIQESQTVTLWYYNEVPIVAWENIRKMRKEGSIAPFLIIQKSGKEQHGVELVTGLIRTLKSCTESWAHPVTGTMDH